MFKPANKTVLRYFLLYLVIYSVAVIGLTAVTVCFIMPRIAEEENKNAVSKMEYIAESVDEEIRDLESLAQRVAINIELKKNLKSSNIDSFFNGTNTIDSYIENDDFISDMVICYEEDKDDFYTTTGKVSAENLFKYEEKYSVCKKLTEHTNNEDSFEIVLYAPENKSAIMMVLCNVPSRAPYDIGVSVIYTISDTVVTEMIKKLYNNPDEGFSILTADGQCFKTVGEKYAADNMSRIPIITRERIINKKINDERVIVYSSTYSGLKYFYHTLENKLFDGYVKIQVIYACVFVFISVIAVLLSVLFSRNSYKPIKGLFSALGHDKTNLEEGGFEELKRLVFEVVDKKNNIEALLKTQKAYIERQLLITIIKTGVKDEERLNDLVTNTEIKFYGRFFRVVLLERPDEECEDLKKSIVRILNNEQMGYVLDEADDDHMILLLCYNKEADWNRLNQLLTESLGKEMKYFSGKECNSLMEISPSYKQTKRIFDAQKNNKSVKEVRKKGKENEKNNEYMHIMKYINENYMNNDMSLNLISEKMGKSIYYISRLIKANLGYNFMDYLSELRIEHAKRLLRETDMRIGDIVEAVGYIDAPGFNKKFKSVEGVTPMHYRNNYRSADK